MAPDPDWAAEVGSAHRRTLHKPGGCSCSILNHSHAPLNRAGWAAPGEGRPPLGKGKPLLTHLLGRLSTPPSQRHQRRPRSKLSPTSAHLGSWEEIPQGDTPDTSMAEQKQENRYRMAAERNVWERRWFTTPQHPSTLPREAREKPRWSTETPHPPQRGHTGWPPSPPAHQGNAQEALEQEGKLQQT